MKSNRIIDDSQRAVLISLFGFIILEKLEYYDCMHLLLYEDV